jgi:hypothetical protein
VLFNELCTTIADQGWARRRLLAVAQRLAAYWGRPVSAEAEDLCRMRLFLPGYAQARRHSTSR